MSSPLRSCLKIIRTEPGASVRCQAPRVLVIAMTAGTLASLMLGWYLLVLALYFSDDGSLWTSGMGIYLVLGAVFLFVAFGARRAMSHIDDQIVLSGLALFVAMQFLNGLGILLPSVIEAVDGYQGLGLAPAVSAVLGTLFMMEAVLFYRRTFGEGVVRGRVSHL